MTLRHSHCAEVKPKASVRMSGTVSTRAYLRSASRRNASVIEAPELLIRTPCTGPLSRRRVMASQRLAQRIEAAGQETMRSEQRPWHRHARPARTTARRRTTTLVHFAAVGSCGRRLSVVADRHVTFVFLRSLLLSLSLSPFTRPSSPFFVFCSACNLAASLLTHLRYYATPPLLDLCCSLPDAPK